MPTTPSMKPRNPRKRQTAEAPAGTQDEDTESSPILSLPRSILRHVLGLQSLEFRLKTCSLVHSAFAAAAAEATREIKLTVNTWRWKEEQYEALAAWLLRYARANALHTLVLEPYISSGDGLAFALPLQQLKGLRVLKLMPCVLPASLRELSSLTALTEIGLHDVCFSTSSRMVTRSQASKSKQGTPALTAAAQKEEEAVHAAAAAAAPDLALALLHMPSLVSVALDGTNALALLPALTAGSSAGRGTGARRSSSTSASSSASSNRLQQQLVSLEVRHASCITPELIAVLPLGLTRLVLIVVCEGWGIFDRRNMSLHISQKTTPRLGQLTALQVLQLKKVNCDRDADVGEGVAALFSSLTQLTSFSIDGATTVADLDADTTHDPVLGAFLNAVGQLSNLRALNVRGGFWCRTWPMADWEEEEEWEEEPLDLAPLCAGLLASTSLTRLVLKEVTLPQHSGAHMFGRPGLRLPHLAVLHLEGVEDPECGGFPDAYLTGDDVASIASCCAGGGLRKLTLRGVTKWGNNPPDYTVFSALTTLTSLSLSTCVKGVDNLVSLRALDIFHADVRDDTLIGVALNLTRLTLFSVWDCDLSARATRSGLTASYDKSGEGSVFEYDEEYCPSVCGALAECLRKVGILPPEQPEQQFA